MGIMQVQRLHSVHPKWIKSLAQPILLLGHHLGVKKNKSSQTLLAEITSSIVFSIAFCKEVLVWDDQCAFTNKSQMY